MKEKNVDELEESGNNSTSKKKKNTRPAKEDNLLERLADELNRSNKDGGKVAYFWMKKMIHQP